MKICAVILLIWNLIVMSVYGFDKLMAKRGGRRVREATLLLLALIFGGAGAMFGMVLFNHKTAKIKFRLIVPLVLLLEVTAIFWLCNNVSLP